MLGVAVVLLKSPDKWAPGHLAETAQGDRTEPTDARAVRWGCLGALIQACALHNISADGPAFRSAMMCLHEVAGLRRSGRSLLDWERDPGRSHEDVLAMLRKAAALSYWRKQADALKAAEAPAGRA